MAVTPFMTFKEKGAPTSVLRRSAHVHHYLLVADTASTVTLPANASVAVFSATDDFYVDFFGGTAIVPAAALETGAGVVLNPVARSVDGLATLSIISGAAACKVTIEFYG